MNTLKTGAESLLKCVGVYHRLKASRLYDAYWMIADRRVLDDRRREVEFYRTHLAGFRPGALVFDIGANIGYKTGIFLRMGARVVAIEPDPHSQDVLRRSFLRGRIVRRPVVIVGQAVSDCDGAETLWLDAPGSAKNTLSQKWVDLLRNDGERFGRRLEFGRQQEIQTISLETLMTRYGVPFFIKIDVEGHEARVLRGLRRPIPYVSFEVNLPEFRDEGQECVELLGALDSGGRFNYATDCRLGFSLPKWVSKSEFFPILLECREPSIEVFWSAQRAD